MNVLTKWMNIVMNEVYSGWIEWMINELNEMKEDKSLYDGMS